MKGVENVQENNAIKSTTGGLQVRPFYKPLTPCPKFKVGEATPQQRQKAVEISKLQCSNSRGLESAKSYLSIATDDSPTLSSLKATVCNSVSEAITAWVLPHEGSEMWYWLPKNILSQQAPKCNAPRIRCIPLYLRFLAG